MTPGWLAFAQDASVPTFALAALLAAAVAAIRVWPQLRQMQITGDASMRGEFLGRIRELEDRIKELEKLVNKKDATHAAREQFLRHEMANESAALDAALAMLKINPDRVSEIVEQVVKMRDAGRQRIALEKGAAAGAAIHTAGEGVESGE